MARSDNGSRTVPPLGGATPMPARELLPHPAADATGELVERALAVAASVLLVFAVVARFAGSTAPARALGVSVAVAAVVLVAAWGGSLTWPVTALAGVSVAAGTGDLEVRVRPGTLPPLPWLDGSSLGADEQLTLCSAGLAGCLAALAVLRRQRDIGRITPGRGYALLVAAVGLGLVVGASGVTGPDDSAVAGLPPVPWPGLLLVVLVAFGPLDLSRDGRLAVPVVVACALALAGLVGSLGGVEAPDWTVASTAAGLGLVLLAGAVSVFALLGRRLPYGTE